MTMTGTGGSGKTRLAIEAAREMAGTFCGGIWFVPLSDIDSSDLLGEHVAQALHAAPSPGVSALHRVLEALPRERCLLLLDNMEQLLPQGAPWIGALLEGAPQLSCLVTSRRRLNLAGENEFPVPPLPAPRAGENSLQEMCGYAGIELFVHRATAARADFRLTERNASAVATLCHRLDGMPLAIEIAASRVGVLSARQIVAHLDDRFELLRSNEAEATPRHRSLRAALDWSYDLLSPALQRAWKELCVIRGGWSLEAAQGVCGGKRVLDALSQLRDHSLILTEETSTDQTRFRMLETLREYALEKMTLPERAQSQRAHAEYFAEFADCIAPQMAGERLAGERQSTATAQMLLEDDNLRVALNWAAQNDASLLLRLGATLNTFWESLGRFEEGRQWLETALQKNDAENVELWAPVSCAAGRFALHCGDAVMAQKRLESALEMAQLLPCRAIEARTLAGLGWLELHRDTTLARDYFRRSLLLSGESGERRSIGTTLWGFVAVAQSRDDLLEVRELSQRALQQFRATDDEHNCAYACAALGQCSYFLRDFPAALNWFQQAMQLFSELGDNFGIAGIFWGRALIARHQGEAARARDLIMEMHAFDVKSGNRWAEPMVLQEFTYQLLAAQKPEVAAQLQGATDAFSLRVGYALPPVMRAEHEEHEKRLKLLQDEAQLRQKGATLSLEQAVELAFQALL